MQEEWLGQLQYAFWDTDYERLNAERDSDYIISRLYCKGGIAGIRAVHRHYTMEQITHAARTRRDLNPIVANYLQSICGLNRDAMAYYNLHRQSDDTMWKY